MRQPLSKPTPHLPIEDSVKTKGTTSGIWSQLALEPPPRDHRSVTLRNRRHGVRTAVTVDMRGTLLGRSARRMFDLNRRPAQAER
jgi:hypothetical protein